MIDITHAHLFCGVGGGALGFQRGEARVGRLQARFRCLGGIDSDPRAIRDFGALVGVPGTVLDLFDREQFRVFHGREPGPDWREATPGDVRGALGGETPDIVFTSPPCKGFSGLISAGASESPRYQALNRLVTRALFLLMEAYRDDPPPLLLLENVPRIAQRGRPLLDQVLPLLRSYGYAVAETTHDCGELGGLAQHRKRFLLVARHRAKVPPFLYEPPRRRVRGVGEVLGELPMPDDPRGGPMHRLPRLTWDTWVRLALIPAGGDWRSLQGIDHTRLRLVPETWGGGRLGVTGWDEAAGTVAGESWPHNGRFAVADPRPPRPLGDYQPYGIAPWGEASGAVTSQAAPGAGAFSVADPRPGATASGAQRHNNVYRVVRWEEASPAVTGGTGPSSGGMAVADPRRCGKRPGGAYETSGTYGVVPWEEPAGTVVGRAKLDTGRWSVADPRPPGPKDRLDPPPVIVSLDGTWHRPFTTLELAALQGFPVLGEGENEPLILDGKSHSRWREAIGNAVPPPAAEAIAGVMGRTLLLARSGQTFELSSTPIWVRDLVIALAMEPAEWSAT